MSEWNEAEFEDFLEAAYWTFDSLKKKRLSERDCFKIAMRYLRRQMLTGRFAATSDQIVVNVPEVTEEQVAKLQEALQQTMSLIPAPVADADPDGTLIQALRLNNGITRDEFEQFCKEWRETVQALKALPQEVAVAVMNLSTTEQVPPPGAASIVLGALWRSKDSHKVLVRVVALNGGDWTPVVRYVVHQDGLTWAQECDSPEPWFELEELQFRAKFMPEPG